VGGPTQIAAKLAMWGTGVVPEENDENWTDDDEITPPVPPDVSRCFERSCRLLPYTLLVAFVIHLNP